MYRQTVKDPTQTRERERERFSLKRAGKWQRGVSKSQKREVLSFSEPKQINKQTNKISTSLEIVPNI